MKSSEFLNKKVTKMLCKENEFFIHNDKTYVKGRIKIDYSKNMFSIVDNDGNDLYLTEIHNDSIHNETLIIDNFYIVTDVVSHD